MHINRKHIRDIENHLTNLHEHFETWSRVSTVAFENVRISLRIDQCLSALESAHLVWVRQLDVYRRQRAALEIGILTEDVLHPDDLRTILQAGRENGQFPLTEEWYYPFVHIQPIWEDKEHLVFTVELPFTDRVTYLRYHLWSWHVASPANYSMPLQVPTDLAYDTEGGNMFIRQDCVHNPAFVILGRYFLVRASHVQGEYLRIVAPFGKLVRSQSHSRLNRVG